MSTDSAELLPIHLDYLHERGINSQCLRGQYSSCGENLAIRYLDPQGNPYKDSRGNDYIVQRLFPTGKPKFKAPAASGSRPYFSPFTPEGYLNNISIPLVFIEGPVKVDACYQAIPEEFCFIGLTGTWNTKDRRDENGIWAEGNDTPNGPAGDDLAQMLDAARASVAEAEADTDVLGDHVET